MKIRDHSWTSWPGGVYLSFGSNLGDREGLLRRAIRRCAAHPRIGVLRVSGLYETAPRDLVGQPDFLNCVAEIATGLSPRDLLRACAGIEAELGRRRGRRSGPRTIDLDILLYREEIIDGGELKVPHPRLAERRFVLEPLCELVPRLRIPGAGFTVEELLRRLEEDQPVARIAGPAWLTESRGFR